MGLVEYLIVDLLIKIVKLSSSFVLILLTRVGIVKIVELRTSSVKLVGGRIEEVDRFRLQP